MKTYLDLEKWPRRKHFDSYRKLDYPYFQITAPVDITLLHRIAKQERISFFKTMVYLVTRTALEKKEFLYRIEGDRVAVYDRLNPSFTYLTDDEVFSSCTPEFSEDFPEFRARMDAALKRLRGGGLPQESSSDAARLYLTSIPWVSYTGMTFSIQMHPLDSAPRIAWGKYYPNGEKLLLPFTVQVNHALMDGYHTGKYFERFQEIIDRPEHYLNSGSGSF